MGFVIPRTVVCYENNGNIALFLVIFSEYSLIHIDTFYFVRATMDVSTNYLWLVEALIPR